MEEATEYILEYRPLEEVLEKSTTYGFELEKRGKHYEIHIEASVFSGMFNLRIKIWE